MRIDGNTKVLGIFGYPVKHSLSPVMQNAAISHLGLNYVYVPFEVAPGKLEGAVNGIRALEIAGVNITVPHKEKVIPFLDDVSQDASIVGSVNTIENRNGRLIGHNTDSRGYIKSLREDAGFEPKEKKILIIGAGGAARGVIAGLCMEGPSKIIIANRTVGKAAALADEFGNKLRNVSFDYISLDSLKDPQVLSSTDLIVNTTSAGLEGGLPEVDFSLTPTHAIVSDIVYKPPVTSFMKKAQSAGLKTIGGLGMLIHQGSISFEIWTGMEAPVDVMKKALLEAARD